MPLKPLGIRSFVRPARYLHGLPVEWIIGPTVVEVAPQLGTHLKGQVGGNRHISPVEESMQIGPEQDAV